MPIKFKKNVIFSKNSGLWKIFPGFRASCNFSGHLFALDRVVTQMKKVRSLIFFVNHFQKIRYQNYATSCKMDLHSEDCFNCRISYIPAIRRGIVLKLETERER